MSTTPPSKAPTREELAKSGLYDPSAPDASDRLALLGEAVSLGASLDDLMSKPNLGELILDLTLRPRLPVTIAQVISKSDLDKARAERLLRALGLSTEPEDQLTADEQVAIQLVTSAATSLLGFESTLQLARAAGEAMARVAEALVTAVRLRVELPHRDSGTPYGEIVKQYSELARTILPDFVRTLDASLRRQIVGVAERMWAVDPEGSAVVLPRTVGFADLVGYTAAASKLSPGELTSVLMEFDALVSEIVVDGGGQLVKMIGDEAMFVTEEAGSACRIAHRLVSSFGRGTLPPVRVGLASGQVVSVFGDIYGTEVNLAARLVDAAEPSTVLVSEGIRVECASEFDFEPLPPLSLRGIAAPVAAARMRAST